MTTYLPYHEEVYFGMNNPSTFTRKEEKSRMRNVGITHILTSLAPRHAEVLQELAILQSESLTKTGHDYVVYKTLLRSCQTKMFVNTDHNLRNILRELMDHHVVEFQRDADGKDALSIKNASDVLETIAGFKRN